MMEIEQADGVEPETELSRRAAAGRGRRVVSYIAAV